jgi:hypothetical protein
LSVRKNSAIVTVVTHNYLQYALALSLSVKEHCPDATFFECLADDPEPTFRASGHCIFTPADDSKAYTDPASDASKSPE